MLQMNRWMNKWKNSKGMTENNMEACWMEKCWVNVIIRMKYNMVTTVIVSNLKVYCMGGGREVQERGDICTPIGWLMLIYGRNQTNIVKKSFN